MNNTEPVTTLYGESRIRTFDSLVPKTFHVMLGGGIVDLYGPTLTVVGLEALEDNDGYAIVQMVLNPFSQSICEVGKTTLGDSLSVVIDYQSLFGLEWGSCPSLLLSPDMLLVQTAKKVYATFLGTFDNGYHLLEGVKKYPADPFKRVGRERKILRTGGHQTQGRKLTAEEATELASHLLRPKDMDMEWKAFMLAWVEAIKTQEEDTPGCSAMSLEKFLTIFSALKASIRFK